MVTTLRMKCPRAAHELRLDQKNKYKIEANVRENTTLDNHIVIDISIVEIIEEI